MSKVYRNDYNDNIIREKPGASSCFGVQDTAEPSFGFVVCPCSDRERVKKNVEI